MPVLDDALESVEAFVTWVKLRHPGEIEFHQAVRSVVGNVIDIAREDPDFRKMAVLQRLAEPDRSIRFRVTWVDDEGEVHINRGYRVQHSNALGPYKGGLRFDPTVNPSILNFLSFEQVFKNSLTGLNLGGGKGGADFTTKGRSDNEIMRFCYSFMIELHRHIGARVDVPAGDIGVGSREIGYLWGQYKRLENQFTGAITGKAVGAGGSELREEATGYGAVYFLGEMLADAGDDIDGKRVTVSGAGNVAIHAAEKAAALGAIVVTLSNRKGCLIKEDGFSMHDVRAVEEAYLQSNDLGEAGEQVGARFVEGGKPWAVPCDIAIPGATQNEIDIDDAKALIANGCKIVVEGANMPVTHDAAELLWESGVTIAPGKAANAGGVAVSGFEMVQNQSGDIWSAEHADEALRKIMKGIFQRSKAEGDAGGRIDLCRGADRAGFRRVARAVAWIGAM